MSYRAFGKLDGQVSAFGYKELQASAPTSQACT
jgi:hypothetical protein